MQMKQYSKASSFYLSSPYPLPYGVQFITFWKPFHTFLYNETRLVFPHLAFITFHLLKLICLTQRLI